jgi:hypothetical protein
VAASKDNKDSYNLLSFYTSLYKDKYGVSPIVNRYKEKWAMQSLIDDFGIDDIKLSIKYYFKLSKDGHPLTWFFNNFSAIHTSRLNSERDDRIRAAARQKTYELRAEYLNGLP